MTSRAKRLALAGAVLVLLSAAVVVPASASLPKSATTTVLAVDSSTLVAGQPIKISVTVTGTTAVPTGTVTVKAGAATVGKIVLAAGMDGSGSLTTSTLPVGTDVLTASFAATGQFSASTSPAVTVGVTKAASRVTLTSSNLNPVAGEPVTLQAAVTVTAPSIEPVKGSVKFYAGTKVVGTAATVSGVAALTSSTLPVGAYDLTAAYPGTTRILPSTSDPIATTVTKTPSSVTLTSSNANPTVGQSVALTATVTVPAPSTEPVKGSVQVYAGTKLLGSATTVSGVASLTTTKLPLGAYGLMAKYVGTTRISASTSDPVPTTVVKVALAPVILGVSPSSGGVAGGTTVTISGSGLTGATEVTAYGLSNAVSVGFSVVSDTTITAVMPAHSVGTVDLAVFVPTSTGLATSLFSPADQYVYLAPVISGVSPSSGGVAGGTTVTISGSGLTGATEVTAYGLSNAVSVGFSVVSDTTITAVMPAHSVGTVDLAVFVPTSTGLATSLFSPADQYAYLAPPVFDLGVALNVLAPVTPAAPAQVTTVSVTVLNTGRDTSPATNVKLTLPAALVGSATGPCTWNIEVGTCAVPALASGTSSKFLMTVGSDSTGSFLILGDVTTAGDTESGNNQAQVMVTVAPANGGTAVQPNGVVSTVAGSGAAGAADNSNALNASFSLPRGLAVDGSGNTYVADQYNNTIRKITAGGVVSTLAGSGTRGHADGIGAEASFSDPTSVALDAVGNLYVADYSNNAIRRITPDGIVTTLAGSPTASFADGTGTAASFRGPFAVTIDNDAAVLVADSGNNRIRRVTQAGVVTTVAGTGLSGLTNGPASQAGFNFPAGIAVDSNRTVYVSDNGHHVIRKITTGGVVSTLAGSGSLGQSDGLAAAASFYYPAGLAVDGVGNVIVADSVNNLVRMVTPDGWVSTLAGTGSRSFADGPAVNAAFNQLAGVAVTAAGEVIVADSANNRIRRISHPL